MNVHEHWSFLNLSNLFDEEDVCERESGGGLSITLSAPRLGISEFWYRNALSIRNPSSRLLLVGGALYMHEAAQAMAVCISSSAAWTYMGILFYTQPLTSRLGGPTSPSPRTSK